jgi:hypothetical protein
VCLLQMLEDLVCLGFGKVELFLLQRRAMLANTPDRGHAMIEDVRICMLPTDAGLEGWVSVR